MIEDLLSRKEFSMYKVDDVHALHYAEACTAYGAIKLAVALKDSNTIQKIRERYDRIESENIPNTANHVDANVYGILPLELYRYNKNKKYLNRPRVVGDLHGQAPILWFANVLL